jgi:prepilin-type N-terminal cleavage/methylation domain-containing protein
MKKSGFTLLELSIVLVIIGLVVGGVMAGTELIAQSKLQKISTEFRQIETAIYGFRNKYNALPGDMANAKSYWPDNSQYAGFVTLNGNGDGTLSEVNTQFEKFPAWQHLALGGFLSGSYTGTGPIAAQVSIMGAAYEGGGYQFRCALASQCISTSHFGRTGNFISLGRIDSTNTNFPVGALLSAQEAKSLDSKMDDGFANTGKLFAADSTTTTGCSAAYASAGADFQLTSTGPQCRLSYWYN